MAITVARASRLHFDREASDVLAFEVESAASEPVVSRFQPGVSGARSCDLPAPSIYYTSVEGYYYPRIHACSKADSLRDSCAHFEGFFAPN